MQYKLLVPIRVLIISVLVSTGLLLALPAAAQVTVTDGNIVATFSSAPLFDAPTTTTLAPTATQTGTITVTNNGVDTESVLLAAVATSSTGLAEAIELVVTEDGLVRYTGTFADFFGTAFVPLSDIAPGANSTYTLTANFLSDSGNQYQGTTMAFDLKIGFASGSGVTSPTGGGGSTGGSSPSGNSNSPDGIVAGIATDAMSGLDTQPWPLWESVKTAISDAVAPNRSASGSDELTASTQNAELDQEGVPKGMVAGIADESMLEKVCVPLWFLLLALLGLLGRSALQFSISTQIQSQTDISTSRLTYALVTAGYVIALFSVHLLIGITPVWGWLLFAVWVLYQVYNYGFIWQHTQLLGRLCLAGLLVGMVALFALPTYVNWLCQWW